MSNIIFEPIVPGWWTPSGVFTKWPEQAPIVSPIPGKYIIHKPFKANQSAQSLLDRGATHINVTRVPVGEGIPNSKLFSGEVNSRTVFQGLSYTIKPGGSADNGRDKVYNQADVMNRGREFGNYPVVMFEMAETWAWDPDDQTKAWLCAGVKERQEQLYGVGNGCCAANYYSIFGGYDDEFWFKPWREDNPLIYEFIYRYPQNQWSTHRPSLQLPPILTSGTCTLSMEAHYRHNNYNETYYFLSQRFRMQLAKKLGLKAGLIVRPDNENIGFGTKTELPNGTFCRKGASPLDPSDNVVMPFFTLWDVDLFALWHNPIGKPNSIGNIQIPYETTHDVFIPKGGAKAVGQPPAGFTYSTDANDSYYGGSSLHYDFSKFGEELYRTTIATQGGTKGIGAYKIDGGAWIEPNQYGAELLYAEAYKRGMFEYRILGDKITVVYHNNFADNSEHLVTLRNPLNSSQYWEGPAFGKMPCVKTFQL